MSALPLPEVPPPDAPDGHGPSPRLGVARYRPSHPTRSPQSLNTQMP